MYNVYSNLNFKSDFKKMIKSEWHQHDIWTSDHHHKFSVLFPLIWQKNVWNEN